MTPEVVFPASPPISLGKLRRDLLKAYNVWQINRASDNEKEAYLCIQQLNLEQKHNLEIIISNQQRVFLYYLENDMPEGVAWHYVNNIKAFYKLQREKYAKNAL